jgi:hypothetical protein
MLRSPAIRDRRFGQAASVIGLYWGGGWTEARGEVSDLPFRVDMPWRRCGVRSMSSIIHPIFEEERS